MKAISLWQPWATLMAINRRNEALGTYPSHKAKGIETRSRAIRYRGELAIHAAKHWRRELHNLCSAEPFRRVLVGGGYAPASDTCELPFGAIVAVGRLVDVRRTEDLRAVPTVIIGPWTWRVDAIEKAFGNYDDGRYGWLFADVRALPHPVPCRGYQMTPWDVPPEVEAQVREQLGAAA